MVVMKITTNFGKLNEEGGMVKQILSGLIAGINDEAGLTMVEYAVAGAIVTTVGFFGFGLLGLAINDEIEFIKTLLA
jgi:Flp pilus assembly pilin Flp